MYYYIKGKPVLKGTNYVVIDVNGIGYRITASLNSLNSIHCGENEIALYTHFIVREDAQELYGFTTVEERDMFELLLTVSGVGPKAAAAILSVAATAELAAAVITDNVKAITKAQGVGPKLAKRIILELRDKIKNSELDIPVGDDVPAINIDGARSDAVSALMALGYGTDEAMKAVGTVEGDLTAEELIKKALIKLM